jgi:hypothetical protein
VCFTCLGGGKRVIAVCCAHSGHIKFWFEGWRAEENQFRSADSAENVSCKLKRKQTRSDKYTKEKRNNANPVLLT